MKKIVSSPIVALIFTAVLFPTILNAEQKQDIKALIDDPNKKLEMTWLFEGSDMPSAEMYFWNNGLLVLDSQLFSKTKTKTYFVWKTSEDGNRLDLTFIDSNVPFKKFLAIEKSHPKHIVSYDESSKTITYRVIDHQSFYFGNWLFEKKK
jgi:hypothetical protein